ncbi:DUF5677 domain-containing protein [Colwellia sp. Bg11-28]|uniref:DUF5677 domain-containing protein n=1 Tax=Colwellia sp. Bg11-28 TaxID=2058305 RepID=UPI000C337815|nr:DUF5677 domain-containing protein [Colwellia sp. Bg11-28]PKH88261.1 hypothetical protein CXF79_05725 [Colwellia sp. Bg11-28]
MDTHLKYKKQVDDLYQLTQIGLKLSKSVNGRQTTEWSHEYASHIYVKILLHIISIQRLLPDSNYFERNAPERVWDIASISSLTRSVIDAYLTMFYLTFDAIPEIEHEFRKLLWDYHGEKKRIQQLECIGSKADGLSDVKILAAQLLEKIKVNQFYSTLDSSVKKDIRQGKKGIYLTNTAICKKSEISEKYFKSLFTYLSSYVHTYPFSLSQISALTKDNSGATQLVSTVLDYLIGFFCQILKRYSSIFPDTEAIIEEQKEKIDLWLWVHKEFDVINA